MRKYTVLFFSVAMALDFACASGNLTLNLAPHVSSVSVTCFYFSYNRLVTTTNTASGTLDGIYWKTDNVVTVNEIAMDAGYRVGDTVICDTNRYGVVAATNSQSTFSFTASDQDSQITMDFSSILITNNITYFDGGGTMPDNYATEYTVESDDITLPEPSRNHYNFDGWYTNSEFSGSAITVIAKGSTGDKTFYAKWDPMTYAIDVRADPANGGTVTGGGTHPYDQKVTLTATPNQGFSFEGWNTGANSYNIEITVAGAAVYIANFKEVNYTITLENQGADRSGTRSITVQFEKDMNDITPPFRNGYDFGGYFASSNGVGKQYYNVDGSWSGEVWDQTNDGSIYAYWIPHHYTLSFNGGEGTGAMDPMSLTYGVETNLPRNLPPVGFERDGYLFAGWKTNLADNVVFNDGQAVSNLTTEANGAVTMYALWSKGHYYVDFDANGGEGEMPVQEFTYDVPLALASNAFTRIGYDFAGWSRTENPTTNDVEFADGQELLNLVSDIDSTNTFYAVWSPERYKVTLDAGQDGYFVDGEDTNFVVEAMVTYGEPYNLREPLNKLSWKPFAGWKYIDGTGTANPLPSTAPLSSEGVTNLVAQWSDGLKDALNAEGTDLDYVTGGYNESLKQDVEQMSWNPANREGATVGQSDLPAYYITEQGFDVKTNAFSGYTYVRTTLPGAGVLTFDWKINAPAGYYQIYDEYAEPPVKEQPVGNWMYFCFADDSGSEMETNRIAELVSGISYNKEWNSTEWQTVAFTNDTTESIAVEWRFRFVPHDDVIGGGTGWVDNVTWTPVALSNDLSRAQVTVGGRDMVYNGSPYEPDVTVFLDGNQLTSDVDYTVAYSDNVNVGTAIITLTGTNSYIGTYTTNFTIAAKTLDAAMIAQVADTNYTGAAIQPEPTVTDADLGELVKDTDYTLSWGENIHAGPASVIVTGMGNYTGTVTNTFTITQAANFWIAVPSIAGWTSGGTPSDPNMGEAKFGTATVTYGESGDTQPTDPGNYTATFTVAETEDYTGLATNVQFTVSSSEPEPKPLDGKFDDLPVTVASDGAGGWTVTLTNDIAAADLPIVLPGDLGQVTIDLNGHVLSDVDGQPAIRVADGASGTEVTFLPVQNDWVTAPSIADWTSGETPSEPVGVAKHGEAVVTYGESGTTPPDAPGDYTATFTVAGTIYYTGLTNEVEFTVKSNEPEPFHVPGEGTVTIPKTWKTGQKVTWKAKAAKGSVFAHWEGDFVDSLTLSANELRNPSLAFAVPDGFDTNGISAVFIAIDDDGLSSLELSQSGPFAPNEAVADLALEDNSESYVTASVSGLPTGLKFDAKTLAITGTPKKSGAFIVKITAKNASGYQWAENIVMKVKNADGSEPADPATVPVPKRTEYHPLTVLSSDTVAGTATGTGVYAEGKKVSISAKPAKNYVFAGWYCDNTLTQQMVFASGDFRKASQSVIVPEVRYLFAKFVTSEDDWDSITLTVDGEDMSSSPDGSPVNPARTNYCGVAMNWLVETDALSEPTVKAAGLPTGVKLVQDKVTKAYSLAGTPTAASKKDKSGNLTPAKVKLTVTTAGKSSKVYEFDWTILPLPDWSVGVFDGECRMENGELGGIVSKFTVAANGKISGKLLESDKTWALSAASFADVVGLDDPDNLVFAATVIGKAGKEVITNEVTVALDEAARSASEPYQRGVVSGLTAAAPSLEWSAWQNLWKQDPWKTDAKAYAKAPKLTVGEIELKFGASGAVTAKYDKYSCSTALIPAEDGTFSVFCYFVPKGEDAYGVEISLEWDADEQKFSAVEH